MTATTAAAPPAPGTTRSRPAGKTPVPARPVPNRPEPTGPRPHALKTAVREPAGEVVAEPDRKSVV